MDLDHLQNVNQKRSLSKHDYINPAQTILKAELHQKKNILLIWWNYKGVVYFELLPNNRTINSNVYCQQLVKLKEKNQNWQIAKESCSTTTMRGLTHLWQHVRNYWSLVEKLCDLKSHSAEFFAVDGQKFHRRGIMKLPERWRKVIEQNGGYLTD